MPGADPAEDGDAAGSDAAAASPDADGQRQAVSGTDDAARGSDGDGTDPSGRDVVVPLRLYKTVTVFSTLFAVAFVLGGFVLIDLATKQATAEASDVDPVLAVLGLLSILSGAAIYAYATRFRAEGMGKPKDQSDEDSDDD